jgi:hypothetical protein
MSRDRKGAVATTNGEKHRSLAVAAQKRAENSENDVTQSPDTRLAAASVF